MTRISTRNFSLSAWILATRPKTLFVGIAPVILGSSLAFSQNAFQTLPAFYCLLFALLVQIGCNYANDYFDFVKGVDNENRVGFKRAVASGLISKEAMRLGMCIVLVLAFCVGLNLVKYGGMSLLIVGIISICCAVLYTGGPFPLGYYGLGDLFVFVFFGLVAVMFTYFVQVGSFSLDSFWIAVACGVLAVNVRLVNDTRDRETDSQAGKKTMAVRLGLKYCYTHYILNLSVALSIPLVLKLQGYSWAVLLPWLTTPAILVLAVKFIQAQSGSDYNRHLFLTSQYMLLYTILLSIGIVL